jgi:hypothetical protein
VLQENRQVGVVALHLNNDELFRVIRLHGTGETGETVLTRSVSEDVMFITPLRHDPDAAFRLKVPVGGSRAAPSQRSAAAIAVRDSSWITRRACPGCVALCADRRRRPVVKIDTRKRSAPLRV